MKACKFEGCDRPAVTRGMCNAHYKRWWAAGKPSDWGGGPPIGALPPKPCVDCGAVLHPVGRRQLRCEPCAAAAQKASQRQYRARVRAGKTVQRSCRVCGKAFKTTDARRVTCGGECSQVHVRTRSYVQPKKRACVVCGQVFETTVHNKRTCGAACARKRARLRVCKLAGCGRSIHAWGMCSTHYLRWSRLGRPENWDGGPPIGAMIPKRPEEHVDWDAFFQRLERNAGPRTAALARLELRRQRQLRAEVRA